MKHKHLKNNRRDKSRENKKRDIERRKARKSKENFWGIDEK